MTQPSAGPWLSPQVVTRKRWPKVLCDMARFEAGLARQRSNGGAKAPVRSSGLSAVAVNEDPVLRSRQRAGRRPAGCRERRPRHGPCRRRRARRRWCRRVERPASHAATRSGEHGVALAAGRHEAPFVGLATARRFRPRPRRSPSSVWPSQSPKVISMQLGIDAEARPDRSRVRAQDRACLRGAAERTCDEIEAADAGDVAQSARRCAAPGRGRRSLSGMSFWPWMRCSTFQSVSPWRTKTSAAAGMIGTCSRRRSARLGGRGVLHADDIVAGIDVMHLAGHGTGHVGEEIERRHRRYRQCVTVRRSGALSSFHLRM